MMPFSPVDIPKFKTSLLLSSSGRRMRQHVPLISLKTYTKQDGVTVRTNSLNQAITLNYPS